MQVTGIVGRGNQVARTFGTPTANLYIQHDLAQGVYKGTLEWNAKTFPACIYVQHENMIEAYAINEQIECYDESISLQITHFIRSPVDFSSLSQEEIQAQILSDVNACM